MTILLPCCTFSRVFDTSPLNEVLTLAELTAALRRFDLRIDTASRLERYIARIRQAQRRLAAGEVLRGRLMGKLTNAVERARKEGANADAALEGAADRLVLEAEKAAKKDLRLWSPALYEAGASKRGADSVTHVSCLVLDYDEGTDIREASTTWSSWGLLT